MRAPSIRTRWFVVVAVLAFGVSTFSGLASAGATYPWTAHSSPDAAPPAAPPTAPPVAAVSPAVGGPEWVNLTSLENGTAPAASAFASLAYDPVDTEWVYFGGCTVAQCPDNETWVYSDGGWRNVTDPLRAPPARDAASMDFDANAGGVLLFGGASASLASFNDTWLFVGGQWTNMSYLGAAPPPRYSASMVFDPEPGTNGSLLFGGCAEISLSLTCTNDTWMWHPGAGWTELLNLTKPTVRGASMMAYDAADGYAVLYGGYGNCASTFCFYNDTWEFYSGTWWPVDALGSTEPPTRDTGAMTYDAAMGGVLLFGGFNETTETAVGDTWLFSRGGWTALPGLPSPSARYASALSVDSAGAPPLLFGGYTGIDTGVQGNTWVFETPPTMAISRVPASAEVGADVPVAVTVGGGTGPFAVSVDFGDGSGSSASGAGPVFTFSHTYLRSANATIHVGVTDLVGDPLSASVTVTIVPGPTIVAAANMVAGDVGLPVAFTCQPGTGSPTLTGYVWTFGDGTNATGQNVSHTFTQAGEYAVRVNASDGSGAATSARLVLAVDATPSATVVASPTAPVAGSPVTFLANVSGGSPPLRFAWLLGDGGSSSVPSPSHVFATAGSYSVQVWVNDSAGGSTHASVSVSVTAGNVSVPPSMSSTPAAIPSWYWIAVSGIAVATAIGATILLLRRTRRPG